MKASETGALGAGSSSPEVRANKEPVVKIDGEKTRTVKVGQSHRARRHRQDDGVPKRRGEGGNVFSAGAAVGNGRGGNAPAAPPVDPAQAAARAARARPHRRRASPSARTSACTCRGSSTAAPARSRSNPLNQTVGRRARWRQLALGTHLGSASHAG